MKFIPGTRVLIVEDCRENGTATGKEGVYEGRFPYNDDAHFSNPRIKLDEGEIIWGIECWWIPLKDIYDIDTLVR